VRTPVLALIAVLTLASTASAQFGGWGRGYDRPEIDSAELERFAEMLDLDGGQVELMEQLHAAYVARVTELGSTMRETMDAARNEFRRTRNTEVWRDLGEIMAEFREQRDKLTAALMFDLQLTLGVDDERWGDVERLHRRIRALPGNAVLSGEGVDLVTLAEDMDIEGREGVGELLRDYEVELDRAIRARDAAQAPIRRDPFAYFGPDAGDDAQEAVQDARDRSAAIRDLHRRFARQLRPRLEPDTADRLDREILERSFPRVYGQTTADQALETIDELDSLTPDQREQVAGLRERYARELAVANGRLAEAIEADEMESSIRPWWGRRGRPEQNPELAELNDERRRVIEDAVAALRSILSDEQAEALPRPGESDWRERARRSIGGAAP
jgi:hypothetical protein